MSEDSLECIELSTGTDIAASVIWLHGLGADGNDFVPIVQELDLNGCPAIRFIFPSAPVIPVTINGGYQMRAWYDILGADLIEREDSKGIRTSALQIEKLIEKEEKRGIASTHIILAGFSQGCAMALHTGLRYPKKLGGLVALSGYLPLASLLGSERSAANTTTPIFMAHGLMDSVVPISRAEASRQILMSLGYSVDWHTYPMPHSVHPEEIKAIEIFLQAALT
ncbi:MAG: carboxylesterase [Burkholderiaceae bacterium]|nr:carboxylesterase [Burkholderiaceae bacterium]